VRTKRIPVDRATSLSDPPTDYAPPCADFSPEHCSWAGKGRLTWLRPVSDLVLASECMTSPPWLPAAVFTRMVSVEHSNLGLRYVSRWNQRMFFCGILLTSGDGMSALVTL